MARHWIKGKGSLGNRRADAFFAACRAVRKVMVMNQRDEEILAALSNCVKVLSIGQIHRAWWIDSSANTAQERLKVLCEADWLVPVRLPVRAVDYFPARPLFQYAAGAEPHWPDLLSETKSRWNVSMRCVRAVVASNRAARFFGGHARHPRPSEATHDLYVSGVFLRMLEDRSADAANWIGEGHLAAEARGREGIIPDALIRCDDGCTAVEIVGESYPEAKLKAFHEYCGTRAWRYELW
jgi:hypothetical protein